MLTKKKKTYSSPEVWGGIECTINRVNNAFFDQLLYGNLYTDFPAEAIADLGIKKIRFPILWEKHQPVLNASIDWSWTAAQLAFFKKKEIDVIAGLVHHGSGPAFTSLLDDNFPYLLAQYAKSVAEQFPWLTYYTPVNEPLTTARFSGLYGLWYPHTKNNTSFLKALLNELKGVVLSMQEIRKINPAAKLVQTEDLGKTYSTPKLKYQAAFENERRWLTYDILCGRLTPKHKLWKLFKKSNLEEELIFFQDNICVPDYFGFNHYITSERFLDEKIALYPRHTHGGNGRHKYADIEAVRVEVEEPTGLELLVTEAWERYGQPIAITEVHLHCHREEQLRWFKYVWEVCNKLTNKGIDIRGVTAWALLGSFGWNKLLTEPGGEYEPGVFDIRSGKARPTALCNFIKGITTKSACQHPLTKDKGWWQRDCRYIYIPNASKMITPANSVNKAPVLIIGKTGTLGKAFARICEDRLIPYRILSRKDCDISDLHSVECALELYKPWAVINAAGYVRVDDAEKEVEQCFLENQQGPLNLATACKKQNIKLVCFSSDLVFDGTKNTPYVESDAVNPLNIYGQSKAESELQVLEVNDQALVIRTSAFFGPWDEYNFLHHVITNLTNKQFITVANDYIISPTYVPDLVHATLNLLIDDVSGIWHLANKGVISWADFAYEAAKLYSLDPLYIKAVSLQDLNYPAARPRFSVLGTEKGYYLPTLENAMQRFFEEKKVHSVSEETLVV